MKHKNKHTCQSCGREIREYNVENFDSLCGDCWGNERKKVDYKGKRVELSEAGCYECDKPAVVKCGWCENPICADHAIPWHAYLRTYRCESCYRRNRIVFWTCLPFFCLIAIIISLLPLILS